MTHFESNHAGFAHQWLGLGTAEKLAQKQEEIQTLIKYNAALMGICNASLSFSTLLHSKTKTFMNGDSGKEGKETEDV